MTFGQLPSELRSEWHDTLVAWFEAQSFCDPNCDVDLSVCSRCGINSDRARLLSQHGAELQRQMEALGFVDGRPELISK